MQRETIAQLYQDQTPSKEGKRSLGWDLRYGFLFHTGYTGTFLCIDPKLQQAFIFLSNRVHPYDFRQEYLEKRDELIAIYLKEKEMIIQTSLWYNGLVCKLIQERVIHLVEPLFMKPVFQEKIILKGSKDFFDLCFLF